MKATAEAAGHDIEATFREWRDNPATRESIEEWVADRCTVREAMAFSRLVADWRGREQIVNEKGRQNAVVAEADAGAVAQGNGFLTDREGATAGEVPPFPEDLKEPAGAPLPLEQKPEPPEGPPPPQIEGEEEGVSAPLEKRLAELNERHAIINNVAGKTVIASWNKAPGDERERIIYQNRTDFMLRYENESVKIKIADGDGDFKYRKIKLSQWWLQNPKREQFETIVFLPEKPRVVDRCLNLWQGWGVEAAPGDWSLICAHITDVIANGNPEVAEYVERWLAWAIQNPGKPAETALVLIGEKGAGKGTLARCLDRIFGAHIFQTASADHVIGRFNDHLQDCIMLVVDEAHWSDDKTKNSCIGKLQGMITEPTLAVEPKGLGIFKVPNLLHIIMLAEPGWVIPAGRNERRYAALEVSQAKLGDKEYWKALYAQINGGGAAAMFHDLRTMDLEGWHPRDIPDVLRKGEALQRQQRFSLGPEEQWYLGLLHVGVLPGALSKRPDTAMTAALYEHSKRKVPSLRFRSEKNLTEFLKDFRRTGIVCKSYRMAAGNGWTFPPLAECRAAWEAKYGPVEWDHADVEEWAAHSLLD